MNMENNSKQTKGIIVFLILVIVVGAIYFASTKTNQPVATLENFDLPRYIKDDLDKIAK